MDKDGPLARSALIQRAWPDGFDDADTAEWLRLSEEAKDEAVTRLRAVLAVVDPVDEAAPMRMVDAAGIAKVALSRMYGIIANWKRPGGRSLASLGVMPRSGPRSRGRDWEKVEKRAKASFSRALDRNPDTRTEDLINAAGKLGLDPEPGRSTLYSWVMEVRRTRTEGVRFGPDFVLDLATIEAVSPIGEHYGLAALVDTSSRLVLGWRVNAPPTSQDLRLAMSDARNWLTRTRFPNIPACEAMPSLKLVSALHVLDYSRLFNHLPKEDGPTDFEEDERRWGRALVRSLGERVGQFRIHAGPPRGAVSARTRHEVALPSVELQDMKRAVDKAIEEHNAGVLALFDGEAGSTLLSALDRLGRFWLPIVADAETG